VITLGFQNTDAAFAVILNAPVPLHKLHAARTETGQKLRGLARQRLSVVEFKKYFCVTRPKSRSLIQRVGLRTAAMNASADRVAIVAIVSPGTPENDLVFVRCRSVAPSTITLSRHVPDGLIGPGFQAQATVLEALRI
jgi:hypothetical protein